MRGCFAVCLLVGLFVTQTTWAEPADTKYYLANYRHLVPDDVEFWEYCTNEKIGGRIL
jgi:hypothetical protein